MTCSESLPYCNYVTLSPNKSNLNRKENSKKEVERLSETEIMINHFMKCHVFTVTVYTLQNVQIPSFIVMPDVYAQKGLINTQVIRCKHKSYQKQITLLVVFGLVGGGQGVHV